MHYLDALLLGVVEGLTEFLPISSTGHLILVSHLLGLEHGQFLKTFEIAIQSGAIFAVIALYWKEFLKLTVLRKLLVAFLPTAVVGFTLYPIIKGFLIGNVQVVVWSLLLGGILLIVFEYLHKERAAATADIRSISYPQALLIGLFQAIAVVPGVSRSGATILGGLLLGLRRATIVEFSFLLAVPTMLAATGYDILQNASDFSLDQFGILATGWLASFVVAMIAIRFLLGFVRSHSFVPFGIYRILLALVFLLFIL